MKKTKNWAFAGRQAVTWVALRVALVLMAFYVVAPFLWMLISSFEPRVLLFSQPPTWFPTSFYTKNYQVAFADPTLRLAMRNSLLVATFSTIIALVLGSLAAYAFALRRFPVSLAYPIMVSMSYTLIVCGARFWLKEQLGVWQIVGVGVILAGVWIVASGMAKTA